MAITLIHTPYPVMSAFNNNYYELFSTNVNQSGFKYLIRVTITTNIPTATTVQNYELTPETGQNGFFDASVITSLIPLQPLPNTVFVAGTTFQKRTLATITVEFAEYYNGTPQPYNVNDNFLTWDASKLTTQLYKVYPNYAYWIEAVETPLKPIKESMIQNLETEYVYENSSTYFSHLDYAGGYVFSYIIKVYNSTGVLQTVSSINNPYNGSPLWQDGHLLMDVGMSSLRNMTPSAGTNPILPSGIDFYYTLTVTTNGGNTQYEVKKYIPKCEPVFNPYVVHYKSRLGSWETALFDKSSSKALDRDLKQYGVYTRINANQLQGSQYTNPIYASSTDRVMNITTTTVYNLNTGWLSEAEVEKYSDLFDSPQIYLEVNLPDANVHFEMLAVPNTYVINKRYNKKRYNLSMSFRIANKENRQR